MSACTSGDPCSIQTALDGAGAKAASGDTVVLLPGVAGEFYTVNDAAAVHIRHAVHVVGDPAARRPLVKVDTGPSASGPSFSFETDAAGSSLSHVAFEQNGPWAVTAYGTLEASDIAAAGVNTCLALNGANSSLVDSTFHVTNGMFVYTACVSVSGENAQVRNVDVTSVKDPSQPGFTYAAAVAGAGTRIEGLRIRSDGTGVYAAGGTPANPLVMRRLDVRGAGIGLTAVDSTIVTDSLVTMSGDHATAVAASGSRLRNVSAIAVGSESKGLEIQASSTQDAKTTDVRNSILRGDGKDVVLDPAYPASGYPGCEVVTPGCFYIPPRPAGTLVIGNSNYRTNDVATEATLTDAGGNSTADPLFVNPGAGDFHLLAGSPAIDTGADYPENGSTDLDGSPRKQGAALDMGAYEYATPAPPLPAGDTKAPIVDEFGLTNEVFAVGRAPTPIAARRKRAKRGTTFVFHSSEAGTAKLSISRARPGRRRGKRCVKPTTRNRKARRCTRYIPIRPALTRAVGSGFTAVAFSGRIGTKALKPGRYRTKLVITDAAGNRSKARTARFRIVRR